MAEKLHIIGQKRQVICITHLPQIAAAADAHYLIQKQTDQTTTKTGIFPLDEDASVGELARLLGGAGNEKYSGQCKRNERNGKESIEFQCEIKKCHILKTDTFWCPFFTFGREDVTKMKRSIGNWQLFLCSLCVSPAVRCLPKRRHKRSEKPVPRQSWRKASYQAACGRDLHGDGWCYGTWYRPDHRRRRKTVSAAENLVRPGDYIVAWNDEKIENKKNCSRNYPIWTKIRWR